MPQIYNCRWFDASSWCWRTAKVVASSVEDARETLVVAGNVVSTVPYGQKDSFRAEALGRIVDEDFEDID